MKIYESSLKRTRWTLCMAFAISLVSGCSVGYRTSNHIEVHHAIAPAVLAAIITAGGVAASAGINAASNAYSNRQNQKNWEKQNEYNSPSAQMQRYRQAGLNPNLIYGSGQSSAGQAGAIAPYQSFKVDSNDVLGMANAMQSIRNMQANTRKANSEALTQELENQQRMIALHYQDSALELDNRLKAAQIGYTSGRMNQLQYQNSVLEAQAQKYIEDALFQRYNRTSLQPSLLSLRAQSVANATAMVNSQLESMHTERIGMRFKNGLLQKELGYYDADRLFRRRTGALGAVSGAMSGLTGFGSLFKRKPSANYNHFNSYHYYE